MKLSAIAGFLFPPLGVIETVNNIAQLEDTKKKTLALQQTEIQSTIDRNESQAAQTQSDTANTTALTNAQVTSINAKTYVTIGIVLAAIIFLMILAYFLFKKK